VAGGGRSVFQVAAGFVELGQQRAATVEAIQRELRLKLRRFGNDEFARG
jgi:hypothetical protein